MSDADKSAPTDGGEQALPPLVDLVQAGRFLTLLDEGVEEFAFQTFDDNADRRNPELTRLINATFDEAAPHLEELNKRGAGIFVTVNATDGRGRKRKNIVSVRTVYRDDDQNTDKKVPLDPHITVESSPGKFQEYWLTQTTDFDAYEGVQRRIVADYDGDPGARDLARVLRLPGFYHQKINKKKGLRGVPFLCRIVDESLAAPYPWEAVVKALPPLACHIEKLGPTNGPTPNWETEASIVRRALEHVKPGAPRDDWLRVGMAIHHASGGSDAGLELWQSWSAGELHDAQPDNYSGTDDVATRWASFNSDRGSAVTVGTLYAKATESGFQYGPNLHIGSKDDDELPELPTASEFLRREYPEPEFLIGPIQNQNIVLIHGPTGIGKTQLGAALSKSLGTGRPWLHWVVERPCRLLYIDAELPPGVLQRWLRLHGVDTDNVRVLNAIELSGVLGQGSHLNLADPRWQEVVGHYATRYQSEVVLVDNVMSAVSVPGMSMSSDEFWKPIYDLALKWRGAGLTSIWFDHSNSTGSVFGTKVKEWNCDLVIKLTQPSDHDPEDGCRFVVEYSKHRGLYGEAVRSFLAWMVTPEPTVSDIRPSARWEMDWNLDAQKKQVFELAVSGASVREIAAQTKVPKSTVNDWLRRERGKKR